ncbi:glycosyltransferase family 25 protein [Dendryphion nanum]|uniref:Glycosyltransferase family 25 protein n=1 Tax=Dendryphion nanum TaxID=256645 RepID=A0A9P9EFV5_9PLEO|nr:glycosyltransferase family 25 protein [Dendryphion nanum]
MPSPSHPRVYLAVGLSLVLLILILILRHDTDSSSFTFTKQYSHSKDSSNSGIANDTLGFEKIFVINGPWRTDRKDSLALAASYSGISLDWIDGIQADDIAEKAYPPGKHRELSKGNRGSWRAHMNALREVIEQNLTTALILEDDADWDFRIRTQLSDFSHAARELPDLVAQAELHAEKHTSNDERLSQVQLAKRSSLPFSGRRIPKQDPYGRDWQVLWLGHCGAALPPASPSSPNRIMISDDSTVPEPQYLKPMTNANPDPFGSLYPSHTRLVHRANTTLCTIAYAVTQAGARRILYEFAIRELVKGYDFALSDYCNGLTRGATKATMPLCITVQPPLFSHHFSERGVSDIMAPGKGGKAPEGTRYIKWSVRMNLERLVKGEDGIIEQWPDTVE